MPLSAPAQPALAPRKRWKEPGLSTIVLEARDRIGGRGHTIMAAPGITFDIGCGWLHSADQNSFVAVAEQLNFEIDKTRPPWREQSFDTGFPLERARRLHRGRSTHSRNVPRGRRKPAVTALPRLLEPGNRWNPMINALSTYINGSELDQVSVLDMDAYGTARSTGGSGAATAR